MPSLEQVCKQIFSDPGWLVKLLVGGLLLLVPVIQLFALGYIYRLAGQAAQMGAEASLPEWDGWMDLFLDGLRFAVLALVLAGVPLLIGWLLSQPFRGWIGPAAWLPLVPAIFLAPPLTAAGLHRYRQRGEFGEAFAPGELWRLLSAAGGRWFLPTFAFIGILFTGFPVLPFAFFSGAVLIFYFYSVLFHHVDSARSGGEAYSTLY